VGTLYGAGQSERVRFGYARGLRLILFVAIPLTAAALALGPTLIRILYGDQYQGAGTILLILLAPVPFVPLASLSSGVQVGLARIRVPVIVSIVGCIVDLGLAAALVPHLQATGAAIANISAQIVGAVLTLWYTARLVGNLELAPRHATKVAVASALAAGSARLVLTAGESPGLFLLAAALGAAVFAALAVWLRVLPREDAEWLVNALPSTTRGPIAWICERLSGTSLATPSPDRLA
jgi:O-antigen/teichoic acid export membrane protein